MTISVDHQWAMFCLPACGRWQSEAQLVGQSGLASRTARIYRELVDGGFCERKEVPILCGLFISKASVRMYRAHPIHRLKFYRAVEAHNATQQQEHTRG